MTATLTESPALPQRIRGLATLARNLGWSWNHDARALYRSIDPTLWRLTRHNPFALLRRAGPPRPAARAPPPPSPPRPPPPPGGGARGGGDPGRPGPPPPPALTGRARAPLLAPSAP